MRKISREDCCAMVKHEAKKRKELKECYACPHTGDKPYKCGNSIQWEFNAFRGPIKVRQYCEDAIKGCRTGLIINIGDPSFYGSDCCKDCAHFHLDGNLSWYNCYCTAALTYPEILDEDSSVIHYGSVCSVNPPPFGSFHCRDLNKDGDCMCFEPGRNNYVPVEPGFSETASMIMLLIVFGLLFFLFLP
jgi:hypothetical protein